MTENTVTEPSRNELEAKIAELEARQSAPAEAVEIVVESTRDRSPVKPQDHKPAVGDLRKVEFGGVVFHAPQGAFNKLSTLDLLERGMINTAIRKVVGNTAYDEFLEKNPDADEKTAGELLEALSDEVGTKN